MTDYPHELDVRPLTTWPGELTPAHQRARSQFSAGRGSTLQILRTELHQLDARHPVLEVAIPQDQWRIDGRPRANARADHPGVVLSLPTTSVGALRYATDRFDQWMDNLRAIALGLEALRKVDRYGVTRRGEQYAGFKALPPGNSPMVSSARLQRTVEEAATILAEHAPNGTLASYRDLLGGLGGGGTRRAEYLRTTWRAIAKQYHPDLGGVGGLWLVLEECKRIVEADIAAAARP